MPLTVQLLRLVRYQSVSFNGFIQMATVTGSKTIKIANKKAVVRSIGDKLIRGEDVLVSIGKTVVFGEKSSAQEVQHAVADITCVVDQFSIFVLDAP